MKLLQPTSISSSIIKIYIFFFIYRRKNSISLFCTLHLEIIILEKHIRTYFTSIIEYFYFRSENNNTLEMILVCFMQQDRKTSIGLSYVHWTICLADCIYTFLLHLNTKINFWKKNCSRQDVKLKIDTLFSRPHKMLW